MKVSLCRMTLVGALAVGALAVGLANFITLGQAFSAPIVVPIDAADPEDGSRWTGVRLASADQRAYLYLYCDSDNTNPRMLFVHGSEISAPTKPIVVDFLIDGVTSFEHYFTVSSNPRAALYFVKTAEMYEPRFGTAPPVFDDQTRSINPRYIAWTDNIYNQVMADLFFGKELDLNLKDASGASHAYHFNLVQLAENIGRIGGCYEPPQIY